MFIVNKQEIIYTMSVSKFSDIESDTIFNFVGLAMEKDSNEQSDEVTTATEILSCLFDCSENDILEEYNNRL